MNRYVSILIMGLSFPGSVCTAADLSLRIENGTYQNVPSDAVESLDVTLIGMKTGAHIHKVLTGPNLKLALNVIDFEHPLEYEGSLGCAGGGTITMTFKPGTVPPQFQTRTLGFTCNIVSDRTFNGSYKMHIFYKASRTLDEGWLQ